MTYKKDTIILRKYLKYCFVIVIWGQNKIVLKAANMLRPKRQNDILGLFVLTAWLMKFWGPIHEATIFILSFL